MTSQNAENYMATSKIPVNDKRIGYTHTSAELTSFYNEMLENGKTAVFNTSGSFRAVMTIDNGGSAGGGKGMYILAFSSVGSGSKADILTASGVTITLNSNAISLVNATGYVIWVNFLVMNGSLDSVTISP